ncbi:general substrate transporter [Gongronella butleri]|nr:general substrate transporter [Gongronella butleri]
MGKAYNITCAAFAAIGSFLFGYDSGIIGSILVEEQFVKYFDHPPVEITGAIVALFQAGCFFGSLAAMWFANVVGRKRSIQIGSVIAAVGGAIQTGSINVGMFIAGRFILGLGIGLLSTIVPLYQAEVSSPKIRGLTVGLAQQFIGFGFLTATWVCYGTSYMDSDAQWRLPVGIQVAPAVVLFFGTFFLPYSPRWLMTKGRDDEARQALARLLDDPAERERTFNEIQTELEEERRVVSNNPIELFSKKYIKRTLMACGVQIGGQLTGVNVATYYGATLYVALGFSTQTSLLVNALFSVAGPVTNFITITSILDRVGRVKLLWTGNLTMGTCLLLIAALYGHFPGVKDAAAGVDPYYAAHVAIIVFMFLFTISFSLSYGPVSWVLQSEVFPLRVRSVGNGVATASNWAMNVWISYATPAALANISWRYFFVYMATNYVFAAITFFFFVETKGKSLEELAFMLGDDDINDHVGRVQDVEKAAEKTEA